MGNNFNCGTNPSKPANLPIVNDSTFSVYVREISRYRSLDAFEEQQYAESAKNGSMSAKQELIKANLKLVVNIAKKIVHVSKLPMIDLVQEGNLGLMVAVEKFNWKLGYRFSTYASWWIKQAIFKAISEQSHSMKIPVYIQETLSKFSKIKAQMEQEQNQCVKNEEVAKKMNMEPDKIDNFLNAYSKTLSLDADTDTNGNSDMNLSEVIEDKKASADAPAEYVALKNDVFQLISTLKDREQCVIRLRFGLGDEEKQTLEEIGKIYGVTKECIRQTESRALKKLKLSSFGASLFSAYVAG
ncbi:MAG: sigma-70 family RNA polymerase sigma factor [Candidatus Gastranaerophilales bacterium]|nr:sigma-70 family RNA polymerase sigma factor [Candidatus Gastranaerophilales bacterium]